MTDALLKVLVLLGLGLHLAAPVAGWLLGGFRLPVAFCGLGLGVVGLAVMAYERVGLEPFTLALIALHLLALASALWWLAAPASTLAAGVAWTAYVLDLLWLIAAAAFALCFKLDRLW